MSNQWKKGSDTRWREFRASILLRDKYTCRVAGPKCAIEAPLKGGQVDHIIPLANGGQKYDPDNARAACQTCNTGRRVSAGQYEPPYRTVSKW